MDWLQFFSFVVAGLLLWVWMLNTRPKNFPPGPWGLPLVGYYPFLGSLPAKKLAELGKKYGSIYSLNIGSKYAVVLNDWKAVKEALIDQNENFSGRPVTYTFNEVRNRTDISSCDGDGWKVKRNFTLQALKTFGFGKASMENLIADEVRISMKQLKSKAGQKVNMHKFFFGAFLNIVWVTAAGSRIELPEKEEKKLYDDIATLMEQASNTNPLQFAPRWKYIPKYRKQHLNYMSSHNAMYSFLDQKVDEHIATYKDGHLRDFIDLFLAESEKRKKSNLNTEFFQRDHLRGILYNLNNGGVDTGNSTLEYSILYMITWPEVQHKVQEELDRVIGRDRMACWEDRKLLPYTEAVILETQRWANVLPLVFPHAPLKTTEVLGYTIPKGTFCLVNAWAVHMDPNYWGDPQVFRPERFLNESGEAVAPDYFIPFSAGRRLCLGDHMAKVEMFLFFSALMQNFTFSCIPGEPLPTLEPEPGLVVHPAPFSVLVQTR